MSTIAHFLSGLFAVPVAPRYGMSCLNATPHDALRLAAAGRPTLHRRKDLRPARPRIVRLEYGSTVELVEQLRSFDRQNTSAGLSVVLVLESGTDCVVRSVIHRRHRADRLVLGLCDGRLPGLDSPADLALASSKLGWGRIEVDRDWQGAIAAAEYGVEPGETLVILTPRREYCGYL